MLQKLFFNLRIFLRLLIWKFAPPHPAYGGGDEGSEPAGDEDETATAGKSEKDKPPAEEEPKVTFTAEQQAAIDKILQSRLDRAKSSWETQQAAARQAADEEAEQKRLAEQQEFKTLADKHAAKVEELKPFKQKAEDYETALTAVLAVQREGRDKGVLALLDNLPPNKQLEWLAANPLPAENGRQKPPDTNAANKSNGAPKEAKSEAIRRKYGIKRRTI